MYLVVLSSHNMYLPIQALPGTNAAGDYALLSLVLCLCPPNLEQTSDGMLHKPPVVPSSSTRYLGVLLHVLESVNIIFC